jgi:hypothetical protein
VFLGKRAQQAERGDAHSKAIGSNGAAYAEREAKGFAL